MNVAAGTFGESGKLTFLGTHYTGGNLLLRLAGSAAENFYWGTGLVVTTEPGPGADFQRMLAKRYRRDGRTANSVSYANGTMVAQIAVEGLRRLLEKGKKVTRKALTKELNGMNGSRSFWPYAAVGPVTFSRNDREGVDVLQVYRVTDGAFRRADEPFAPRYASR